MVTDLPIFTAGKPPSDRSKPAHPCAICGITTRPPVWAITNISGFAKISAPNPYRYWQPAYPARTHPPAVRDNRAVFPWKRWTPIYKIYWTWWNGQTAMPEPRNGEGSGPKQGTRLPLTSNI